MEKNWIRSAFCLLFVCTLTSGIDGNKTTPKCHASADNKAFRKENVKMSTNVSLYCNNSKIAWKNMFYIIWNISMQSKNCCITAAVNDTEYDTCKDGKKLEHSPHGEYYLSIPHFSIKDEGNYNCEVSYHAGAHNEIIHVSAWVRPRLTSWLEFEQGRTVAVCEAADGRPAANIRWETTTNTSLKSTTSQKAENGLFTVKSRLPLTQSVSSTKPVCVATVGHPNQTEIRTYLLDYLERNPVQWPLILLAVCAICFTVALLTVFYLMRERLFQISIFRKVCCDAKSSGPIEKNPQEKTPQPRDLEEVEPYASYVQRVNSIYNSSAELFNA